MLVAFSSALVPQAPVDLLRLPDDLLRFHRRCGELRQCTLVVVSTTAENKMLNWTSVSKRLVVLSIVAAVAMPTVSESADWAQWRGPNRDGISSEQGLLQRWPAGGPKLIWQVRGLGDGYGAPSVADGMIYIVVNKGLEQESVKALDVKDGSQRWSTPIGKVGEPNQRPNYPAARSTPTVVGDSVYALGSDGDLVCLESASGKIRWQRSLRSDFGGAPGQWAYAESPLVDDDLLIVAPGGEEAALVALNRDTGESVWKAAVPGSKQAGYASIVTGNAGDVKQYIAYLGLGLVGVEAATGKFLWLYDGTKGQANSATPLVSGDFVYSGAGRVGGGLVKLTSKSNEFEAEQLYFSPKLPNAQGGSIKVGDYLYGGGRSTMMCIDFESGEVRWEERIPDSASMCFADNRLYLHLNNGDVMLVESSPEAFREQGKFSPPNQPDRGKAKAWAYPVVANGRLYIRDLGSLWCYDLRR
jgi:outer membrane protein assembly factor BamB